MVSLACDPRQIPPRPFVPEKRASEGKSSGLREDGSKAWLLLTSGFLFNAVHFKRVLRGVPEGRLAVCWAEGREGCKWKLRPRLATSVRGRTCTVSTSLRTRREKWLEKGDPRTEAPGRETGGPLVFPARPPLPVGRHQLPFRHGRPPCWGWRGRAQETLPLADKGGRPPNTNLGCADTLSSLHPITPFGAERTPSTSTSPVWSEVKRPHFCFTCSPQRAGDQACCPALA